MAEVHRPEWWFYHLSRSTLEQAVPPLLEKCLERGWWVLAVSPLPERRVALDETLWTYDDESFLAHGRAEAVGIDSQMQPVLIAAAPENANEATVAMLMDGADLETISAYERVMVVFDHGDEATRQKARQQFKAAKDGGCVVRYFQQTSRGWSEAGSG